MIRFRSLAVAAGLLAFASAAQAHPLPPGQTQQGRGEWDHDEGPWQHDDRDERWGDRARGDVFDSGFDVRADPTLTAWALRHFDLNRDGRLGGSEARAANDRLWRIADRNRNGRISPGEYRRARARLARS